MTPAAVSRIQNLNASNTRSVPSQMYLLCRPSRSGPNVPASLPRVTEFIPSAATTRSWLAASSATSGASVRNLSRTPSSAQRACRMASRRLRLIAANPWPPEVNVVPRKCTSMSSQRANSRLIAAKIPASACSMPPRVSSENTTPKPNVSSAALRSQTVISCPASSCLASAAKYRPPGPPPRTEIRTPRRYAGTSTIDNRTRYSAAMNLELINPGALGRPSGFSHAVSVSVPASRMVFLAGQVAMGPDGTIVPGGIVAQFERALANVLTALTAAGGQPADLVSLTIYLTDVEDYQAHGREIGAA